MKVRFNNVGRDNATWDCEVASFNPGPLVRAVRRKNCLASHAIDVEFSPSRRSGTIFAGTRSVGTFQLIEKPHNGF